MYPTLSQTSSDHHCKRAHDEMCYTIKKWRASLTRCSFSLKLEECFSQSDGQVLLGLQMAHWSRSGASLAILGGFFLVSVGTSYLGLRDFLFSMSLWLFTTKKARVFWDMRKVGGFWAYAERQCHTFFRPQRSWTSRYRIVPFAVCTFDFIHRPRTETRKTASF